jgi:hypothetical protein
LLLVAASYKKQRRGQPVPRFGGSHTTSNILYYLLH